MTLLAGYVYCECRWCTVRMHLPPVLTDYGNEESMRQWVVEQRPSVGWVWHVEKDYSDRLHDYCSKACLEGKCTHAAGRFVHPIARMK